MLIKQISTKNDLFAIWNTDKWIIYNNFSGVVAESNNVVRYEADENGNYKKPLSCVHIVFTIAPLATVFRDTITRAIRQLEREKMGVDRADIGFVQETDDNGLFGKLHLNKNIIVKTEDR